MVIHFSDVCVFHSGTGQSSVCLPPILHPLWHQGQNPVEFFWGFWTVEVMAHGITHCHVAGSHFWHPWVGPQVTLAFFPTLIEFRHPLCILPSQTISMYPPIRFVNWDTIQNQYPRIVFRINSLYDWVTAVHLGQNFFISCLIFFQI